MKRSIPKNPPLTSYEEDIVVASRLCDTIAREAENRCQQVWSEMHANRSKIIDIDAAIIKVNETCRSIREEARKQASIFRKVFQ